MKRNLKNEQKAIEQIRDFTHPYDRDLANECTGRTLLSIYSVIRRFDARNHAVLAA